MKPIVFIFLSWALHAGAAEPVRPAAHKAAWFSGLQDLKASMSALNGLGENMANRPGPDASRLKDFEKPFKSLELIRPVADIRLADR
jgi:hypothetical protein